MNDDADLGAAPCSCKVGRDASNYDLPDLDRKLRRRHAEGASLRELERHVNEALLESALREADVDAVGGVDSLLHALVDDAASAGTRTEARERLARAGVDVESLTEDFVSYQTVRTHLRECLDVETGRGSDLTAEDARGTIAWARSRNEGVIRRTLERLDKSGELSTGGIEVSTVVRVTCTDCDSTYLLHDLLERGGCDCAR